MREGKIMSDETQKALERLSKKYPDETINNSISIGKMDDPPKIIPKEQHIHESMKRSDFKNLIYSKCKFEKVAFTNSSFYSVVFSNCNLDGNSFACCNCYNSKFIANKTIIFDGNNFSQSSFNSCEFLHNTFSSSAFLQTLFNKCVIKNTCVQSCTMEGSQFINCRFENMDFGSANIEFIELIHTTLSNVIFPFYQLPYIIGIFDYTESEIQKIKLRVGKRTVYMKEYIMEIDDLILYYQQEKEYFPKCNLQILKGDIGNASQTLLEGVNASLDDLDFRMIRHFCRLASHHNLINEITTRRILKSLENYLASSKVPPERLNECIIHMGEIRRILLSGNSNSVTFNLNIRTNICKKNQRGMQYINSLCNEMNEALSQNDFGQLGFEIAISNHSPFDIVINIICAVGSLATIAQFIWQIIDRHEKKQNVSPIYGKAGINIPDNYVRVDVETHNKYIDARIDQCKEELLRIKDSYSGKKMNKYIEEITQNLKTDLDEFYQNDIMIFKNINHPE